MSKTKMSVFLIMTAPVDPRAIQGCAKSGLIQDSHRNKTTVSAEITTIAPVVLLVISGRAKSASIQEKHQNQIKMGVLIAVIAIAEHSSQEIHLCLPQLTEGT